MGLSPGLDFESKLFAKPDAARLLDKELSKDGYQPRTIAIGTNTDPYQPIEKQYRIMREILEVLEARGHPVGIVTKSALVTRDIDILVAHGRTRAGQGGAVGDDARPHAGAHHGAARLDADQAAGGDQAAVARPAFRPR